MDNVEYRAVSYLRTSLVLLYCLLPLSCCIPMNETSSNSDHIVTSHHGLTADDILNHGAIPNESATVIIGYLNGCSLSTVDPFIHNVVTQLLEENSLIEYRLSFPNYTFNPPTTSETVDAYQADRWARTTNSHGQIIRSLAFNYKVLSLSTLALETETLNVELVDSPDGCFGNATYSERIDAVQDLLMRDFVANGPLKAIDDARVCHEVIVDDGGYAQFQHNCCFVDTISNRMECTTKIGNVYLNVLYVLFTIVRVVLPIISPAFFISTVVAMSKDKLPYVVKLKNPITKIVQFHDSAPGANVPVSEYKTLDLSDLTSTARFTKFKQKVHDIRKYNYMNKKLKVKFDQCDITVNYKYTMKENSVKIGLFQTLFRTLFKCDIRHKDPWKGCCERNIFATSSHSSDNNENKVTWSKCCRCFSKLLLVLVIPFPYYIRLGFFYGFEAAELFARRSAVEARGLKENYGNSFIHYFTLSHFYFIIMYFIYAIIFILSDRNRLWEVIVNSFKDLRRLSTSKVLRWAVFMFILPLKRYGIYGFLVGLVYWPLVLPYTVVVCSYYLLPTVYLSHCIYTNTMAPAALAEQTTSKNDKYQVPNKKTATSSFKSDKIYLCPTTNTDDSEKQLLKSVSEETGGKELLIYSKNLFLAVLGILTLISCAIIFAELVGFLFEIATFTIMGIIVNAQTLLRYVTLLLMILVYCADCFNNVTKKYHKMSKALFSELKSRIKDEIEEETSKSSTEQENRGFQAAKVQEQSAQADGKKLADTVNGEPIGDQHRNQLIHKLNSRNQKDFEKMADSSSDGQHISCNKAQIEIFNDPNNTFIRKPDDICQHGPKNAPEHWHINELVMFVDNKDVPRIPRELFDRVCNIRTPGVPGPFRRGLLEAVLQLLKLTMFVCFIYIIVLSLGSVYNVSSANQTLAALLLGFMPMLLKLIFAPPEPEVELDTVSFKCKMDEVIKNFNQPWPMYDLPFELVDEDTQNDNDRTLYGTTQSQQNDGIVKEPTTNATSTGATLEEVDDNKLDLIIYLPKRKINQHDIVESEV